MGVGLLQQVCSEAARRAQSDGSDAQKRPPSDSGQGGLVFCRCVSSMNRRSTRSCAGGKARMRRTVSDLYSGDSLFQRFGLSAETIVSSRPNLGPSGPPGARIDCRRYAATNTGNADAWNIELVAGQGALDHSETLINGSFAIDNTGDVVWVSTDYPPTSNTDTSGFISALGHGTSTGTIANAAISQFGSGVIWNGNLGTGSVIANTGGTSGAVATATATETRGTTNGGANDLWVASIREYNFVVAVPEPSRVILMLGGACALVLRRRRKLKS